jgi:hypothetical protein
VSGLLPAPTRIISNYQILPYKFFYFIQIIFNQPSTDLTVGFGGSTPPRPRPRPLIGTTKSHEAPFANLKKKKDKERLEEEEGKKIL